MGIQPGEALIHVCAIYKAPLSVSLLSLTCWSFCRSRCTVQSRLLGCAALNGRLMATRIGFRICRARWIRFYLRTQSCGHLLVHELAPRKTKLHGFSESGEGHGAILA